MFAAALLLAASLTTAPGGFTKAEIDALPPPPGPDFFTRDDLRGPARKEARAPGGSAAGPERTPRQRVSLAVKAQRRRARARGLDGPIWDGNLIFAEQAAGQAWTAAAHGRLP